MLIFEQILQWTISVTEITSSITMNDAFISIQIQMQIIQKVIQPGQRRGVYTFLYFFHVLWSNFSFCTQLFEFSTIRIFMLYFFKLLQILKTIFNTLIFYECSCNKIQIECTWNIITNIYLIVVQTPSVVKFILKKLDSIKVLYKMMYNICNLYKTNYIYCIKTRYSQHLQIKLEH